ASVEEVIRALRRAHSYEEPAFDIYPLRTVPAGWGEGRVGRLAAPVTLRDLAQQAATALQAPAVQVVGDRNRQVERVAIVWGAGGDFVGDAVQAGAEVLLTGEARFHECLAAQGQGLGLVLPGHYATERFAVEELAAQLQAQFPTAKVWAAQT